MLNFLFGFSREARDQFIIWRNGSLGINRGKKEPKQWE